MSLDNMGFLVTISSQCGGYPKSSPNDHMGRGMIKLLLINRSIRGGGFTPNGFLLGVPLFLENHDMLIFLFALLAEIFFPPDTFGS